MRRIDHPDRSFGGRPASRESDYSPRATILIRFSRVAIGFRPPLRANPKEAQG